MGRMDDRFSASNLVELVHQLYPAGVASYEPEYETAEETQRRAARRKAAMQGSAAWERFRQRIVEELPGVGLWELPYLMYHPCRMLRVYLPHSPRGSDVHDAVVLLESVLAPVHAIYASHQTYAGKQVAKSRVWHSPLPARFRPYEARVDEFARSLLGSVRLPKEVLFTPVPDLHVEHVPAGKVKLIHCLFMSGIW
jgi:hypothetical protein